MGRRYGLEIRAAAETDAAGLAELLAQAGHAVAPVDLAARIEALRRAPGAVLLAQEWGPPSGIVVVHWHHGLTEARPVAGIDLLLVGADARRRGVGRLLLKAAARAARQAGCGAMRLRIGPDRSDLAAFAAAAGFVPDGSLVARGLRKGARGEEGARGEDGED